MAPVRIPSRPSGDDARYYAAEREAALAELDPAVASASLHDRAALTDELGDEALTGCS
jgi:hypothetical protein